MKRFDKKGISIFTRLLMAIAGLTLAVGSLLMASSYVLSRKSIEKRIKEGTIQQLTIIGSSFAQEYRINLLRNLKSLACSPLLDEYLLASESEQLIFGKRLERLFLQTAADFPGYQSICYIDHQGIERIGIIGKQRMRKSGTLRPASSAAAQPVRPSRDSARERLFWQLASRPLGEVLAIGPFREDGRVTFLAGIAKMDMDTGKLGGVIIISYSLEKFFAHLNKVKIFDENPVWVFAPHGSILKGSSSRTSGIFNPQGYLTKAFQAVPRLMTVKEGLVVYQDMVIIPDKPFIRVAIAIPSSLIHKDIQSVMSFFFLVFAISFLAAFVMAFFIARYLSSPIIALACASARLAKGDLSTRVRIHTGGEIQMLIESFNQMANDLEKTTASKDSVINIIKSMIDTLIVVSPQGRVIWSNAATQALLGYTEEELIGQPAELFWGEDEQAQDALLSDILTNGSVSHIEKTYRTRDGRKIPVLFSASVMRDPGGKIEGIVCGAHDISERKRAQEALAKKNQELERVNKELNQFAYVVSHDLKAPLRAIANLSQWIQEDIGETLTDETLKQLELLRGRVHRMEALINGILEYSRIGRVAVEHEMVDTGALLAEIIDSLAVPEGFTIRTAPNMPVLLAPRIRLHQVFANLISNAVKYSNRNDGVVDISASHGGAFYEFRVADNGPGIAPKYHERIFLIFQTLASRDTIESTGVGLTLVKKIVEEQGGSVAVESDIGQGATFKFTWPRYSGRESHHEGEYRECSVS